MMWTDKIYDPLYPPVLVAELSGNHNHSLDLAKELVHAAAEVGADAVKLQTFKPETITVLSNSARYQINKDKWGVSTLAELYAMAAMPWDWQIELRELASNLNIGFFSTPFDRSAVDFLMSINVDAMKIASPEIVDLPLIEYVMMQELTTIVSTGGANRININNLMENLTSFQKNKLILLHCIAEYPASVEDANLATMREITQEFGVKIGLSDHSIGSETAFGATLLGARLIEKHITIDRNSGGIDSTFSSEPAEFKELKKSINSAHVMLGKSLLGQRLKSEEEVIGSQRSLVALSNIKCGENFTEANIGSRRPGGGLAPKYYNSVLGKTAREDIAFGDPIQQHHFV